jgi:hypothetical protein
LIPEKLGLDCKPDVAGGGTVLGDGVGEVVGDGAKEPGSHDTIHASPISGGRNGGVREDMALQRIPPKGEEEGLAPASVECGRPVEVEGDEQADVLHRSRLRVEVEERGAFVLSGGVEDGLVVDGGKGGVIVVVVMGRQGRKIGRDAFLRGSVKSGAKTSVGGISIGLCRGGFAFCSSRTGECSVAGSLAGGDVTWCHRPAVRMKVGGGGSSIFVGHEQCRKDALGAAPRRRAWRGGALGAAPCAEEGGLGENLDV